MNRKALIGVLALWAMDASAQLDSGYYLGAAVGQFDYRENASFFAVDDTSTTYRLYGGFRFDDIWAMEAYYGQTGDLTLSDSIDLSGVGTLTADIATTWEIIQVRGIAHLKAFYAGVGYWDGDVDVDILLTDPIEGPLEFSGSGSDDGYALILGGEWEFSDWAVRAEYEYFDTDTGVDISIISIGGHYKF